MVYLVNWFIANERKDMVFYSIKFPLRIIKSFDHDFSIVLIENHAEGGAFQSFSVLSFFFLSCRFFGQTFFFFSRVNAVSHHLLNLFGNLSRSLQTLNARQISSVFRAVFSDSYVITREGLPLFYV